MATTLKNRKMKLIMVLNTFDGVKHIGCRATGMHKGYHIEKTAWAPYESAPLVMDDTLRMIAEGKYRHEVSEIDKILKGQPT